LQFFGALFEHGHGLFFHGGTALCEFGYSGFESADFFVFHFEQLFGFGELLFDLDFSVSVEEGVFVVEVVFLYIL
jgi:hypothetical protein